MLDTSEKQTQNLYFEPTHKNDTIVLECGVFELKAGYLGNPCMIFKNRLYKNKDKISLEPFSSSSVKSMFDNDVIINFDVLEQIMDLVLSYLKPSSLKNLIFTTTPNSPTENELIEFLFETYKFDNIQIGYDFVYAYHKYYDEKDCVVVDFKYSSVVVCVIKDSKILDLFKINFGGKELLEYINYCMVDKYKENRRDYRGLVKYLRVAEDYETEALEIYNEMCNGIYEKNVFLTDPSPQKIEPTAKKVKRVEKPAGTIPILNYDLLNAPDESLDKDQLKEKRRLKMIYCSTLARLKTKIDRLFVDYKACIANLEDELEKQKNLETYIAKKKARFDAMKRVLELREQMRRDAKNKKSREFSIKFKEGELSREEQDIKNRILDAEDEEQDNSLAVSIGQLAMEIVELDPGFIPFYANTVEILRGDNLGRQCANIELIKWPEIIFDPSIIGSEQMGLSEIFENIFPQTQIENVLICGGFSFINGFDRRIENEIRQHLNSGRVNVVKAIDSQKDPFNGARFSNLFPIHSRVSYENLKRHSIQS